MVPTTDSPFRRGVAARASKDREDCHSEITSRNTSSAPALEAVVLIFKCENGVIAKCRVSSTQRYDAV